MKEWFLGLETRERRILVIGSIVAIISLLYGGVIAPLFSAVETRQNSVRQQTELLAWIQSNAGRKRTDGEGPGPVGDPVTVLSRQARSAGLQSYLERSRPTGDGAGVRAEFRNAPFDDLMRLLGRLESTESLRVVDATVLPGDNPGTGTVRVTLLRAGS